ncbi:MAG TPA: hypothetical protein VEL76_18895 [Gemmataceae bacterium]|nr:hypothetical protein [Gemmataceae bacterium]
MQPSDTMPAPPACVLCLVRLSASMASEFPTEEGPQTKARFVRRFLDRLLDGLVAEPDLSSLEVGVVGHVGGEDGGTFVSLLPGTASDRVFLPVAELARVEVARRPNGSSRRVKPIAPHGEVDTANGLLHAYRLVQRWLSRPPFAQSSPAEGGEGWVREAAPPLVIHFTDGEACNSSLAAASRSLRALDTPGGGVVLFHCVVSEHYWAQLAQPSASRPANSPWAELWDASSPLWSRRSADCAQIPRALTINAAPQEVLLGLIRELTRTVPALPLVEAQPAPAPRWTTRVFRTARLGNAEEECEDTFALNIPKGVAALADGAGEGIFSKVWAELLTAKYGEGRPDLSERAALTAWLQTCRKEWRQGIDYAALRWSVQTKVDRTGAAATFLGLRLNEVPVAGEDPIIWRAVAVGDSCLFWFRDGQLHAAFPVLRSAEFGLTPALLRSKLDAQEVVPLVAQGRCRPGDLFVLATDAVAQWLLHRYEQGQPSEWERFEKLDEAVWKEEINALRRDNHIVNDDCTMLLLRIQAAGTA